MQERKEELEEYIKTFVQRLPRYSIKAKGSKKWITKKRPLADPLIMAHLDQKYIVGVLGKWYPGYAILDIDNTEKVVAEEIREKLKLDISNSMLLTSESENSYHVLFKPSYKSKPPTINLLNEIIGPFANEHGIEVYPQANKAIRLPFGNKQNTLDFEYINLDSWQEKLYWFNKLDPLDLQGIPYQQLRLDLNIRPDNSLKISTYEEGRFLYQTGLIEHNSRHKSQFKVLYYFWRQNYSSAVAIDLTWQWIKNKHNNNSRDILTSPHSVRREIERQAHWIYEHFELVQFYPDEIHNGHKGFITKKDITEIFYTTEASLPKAKFLFSLVKFCYPRRYNTFIQLHSDNLKEWSFRGYKKHLEELQKLGIVKRYDSYKVDNFAKSIKINWNFKDTRQAILIDSRAPETLADTITVCYKPEELRELLLKAGSERTNAIKAVKSIYEGVKKVNT